MTRSALLTATLAAASLFAVAPVRAQTLVSPAAPMPGTIMVSGEGSVTVPPDRAVVRLGVRTTGATAAETFSRHEDDVARVLGRVRQLGIADRFIQIDALQLGENYGPNGPDGYVAQRTVSVTMDSLRTVPALVAAVVGEGANQLQGLEYVVRDTRPAELRALDAAVADARAKAGRIAAASGVSLGRVVAVQEGGAVVVQPPMAFGRGMAVAMDAEPGAYSTGQNEVRATVTVVFAAD